MLAIHKELYIINIEPRAAAGRDVTLHARLDGGDSCGSDAKVLKTTVYLDSSDRGDLATARSPARGR